MNCKKGQFRNNLNMFTAYGKISRKAGKNRDKITKHTASDFVYDTNRK